MSAPFYGLEWKVENALRTLVLAANRDGVPVYLGSDNKSLGHQDEDDSKALQAPYIICSCNNLELDVPGQHDGVWKAVGKVEVWTHKHDEPGNAHAERVGWVRDVLCVTDLPEQLSNAVADFHCFQTHEIDTDNQSDGPYFATSISIRMVITPSDM